MTPAYRWFLPLLTFSCLLLVFTVHKFPFDQTPRTFPKKKVTVLVHNHLDSNKKTAFPRDSPFFGLSFQETYGLPCSVFAETGFKQVLEDWRDYMPEFQISLPKHKPVPNFYVKNISKVFFVDEKIDFKVGDELNARIEIQEKNNLSRGGDYFIARLVYGKPSLYPDGIPGKVTDHRNGSYSIQVPLLIPGQARLEVKLIVSLRGIAELIRCTSTRSFLGSKYVSVLETGEVVECNVDFNGTSLQSDDICDYSNPRNQEPWFCAKPASKNCSRIADTTFQHYHSNFYSNYDACNDDLIRAFGWNITIPGSGLNVTVKPSESKLQEPLALCKTDLNGLDSIRPNGYVVDGSWHSRLCYNSITAGAPVNACFENKVVYFLGDSTIRQFYYLAVNSLGLISEGPNNGRVWQQPQTAGGPGNSRLYYRAHGPPLQNPGPPKSRPYMSDVLDEILPGDQEVVIVLNIGLHILYFEPSVLIHRLKGIRDAMLRLNQRRSNVRYIYRSQRVLSTLNSWLVYRHGVITRKIFKDVNNFFYFDLWDISALWPLDDYHPKAFHVEREALFLFSYICNGIQI
nr:NXPE family member 3 isoform X1 [Ciona intestinalis]|eukprot:XP_002124187.1 NXPE family member 3 isoform X1 [Ciona intestinalis]